MQTATIGVSSYAYITAISLVQNAMCITQKQTLQEHINLCTEKNDVQDQGITWSNGLGESSLLQSLLNRMMGNFQHEANS